MITCRPKKYFDKLAVGTPYYRHRWSYYSVAQRMVTAYNPSTVLEIGAYYTIFEGSDTLDIPWNTIAMITHDIGVVPWPIEDKGYDVVCALQVWEHVKPSPEEAFRELMRVCNQAVLSFPIDWTDCEPGDDHLGVTAEVISKWTLGIPPVEQEIIGHKYKRQIMSFDFTKELA